MNILKKTFFWPPAEIFLDPPLSWKYIFFHLKIKIDFFIVIRRPPTVKEPVLRCFLCDSPPFYCERKILNVPIPLPIVKEKVLTFVFDDVIMVHSLDDSISHCERKIFNILDDVNMVHSLWSDLPLWKKNS